MASLLLLDVSGAFDNISRPRLLHDLRKRHINQTLVRWIDSFLIDRSSILKLQEYTAPSAPIQPGIPQGSPLSPILYLFYNTKLIKVYKTENTEAIGYIDNISILAVGSTAQANCKTLKAIHRKAEKWALQHRSQFAPAKSSSRCSQTPKAVRKMLGRSLGATSYTKPLVVGHDRPFSYRMNSPILSQKDAHLQLSFSSSVSQNILARKSRSAASTRC